MCSAHGPAAVWASTFLLHPSVTYRAGKGRHAPNQELVINPIFKCDKCSYIVISGTALKHCTTMKHRNKKEPETFWKLYFLRFSSALKFACQKSQFYRFNMKRRFFFKKKFISNETSLLRRLQAQTLPHWSSTKRQINPFSKMAVTFEQLMGFWCPSGLRKFLITMI